MSTLIVDLSPELERRLEQEAARHGLSMSEYVRIVLEQQVQFVPFSGSQPFHASATPAEWEAAFRQWAAGHETTSDPVPLEALRREHLYEDRE